MLNDFIQMGLVQAGLYHDDTLRFQFELLGSYPQLLDQLASEIVRTFDRRKYDRIVATSSAIALGVCVSQKSQIPLVYRAGHSLSPVLDFIGAYDVGHPTLMLTDVISSEDELNVFIAQCRSVGLIIEDVHCLCIEASIKPENLSIRSVTTTDLMRLHIEGLIK